MISVELALALRGAGLTWRPAPGDRFVLPHRGMDEEVFVLSDMTVDVHEYPTGVELGFNGVTEWALDSVQQDDALWLPAEHQLRELLGGLFERLERAGTQGFSVTVGTPSGPRTFTAGSVDAAYGQALLAVLRDLGEDR